MEPDDLLCSRNVRSYLWKEVRESVFDASDILPNRSTAFPPLCSSPDAIADVNRVQCADYSPSPNTP
jgi:hypothetical protein